MTGDTTASGRRELALAAVIVGAFAFRPFLELIADNGAENIDFLGVYGLYPLVLALLTIGLAWAVSRRFGAMRARQLAVAFAVLMVTLLEWDRVEEDILTDASGLVLTVVALVLYSAIAVVAWRLGRRAPVRDFAVVAGVLLVLLQVVRVVEFEVSSDRISLERTEVPELAAGGGELPDVYYFVLDGYTNPRNLKRFFDVDGGSFADGLRERGFRVADEMYTPYPLTELSVGSTLSWDYATEMAPERPRWSSLAQTLQHVITGDNPTVEAFESLGYRFAYGSDRPVFRCQGLEDFCLEPDQPAFSRVVGEHPLAILRQTPLARPIEEGAEKLGFDTGPPHIEPSDVPAEEAGLAEDGPLFSVTHILSPHHPWRYAGESCELRTTVSPVVYRFEDRDSVVPPTIGYADNLRCLNRDFTETVDEILARDPDAVIAVQGDHGSRLFSVGEELVDGEADAESREVFGILYGLRLPERCENEPFPETPVGTFPAILTCLTETDLPQPEPRHFYVEPEDHLEPEEIPHDLLVSPSRRGGS